MSWQMQIMIVAQVALAMLLGGLIGLERELADKPAGLRTHIIVAGACALFMAMGDPLLAHFQPYAQAGMLRADPTRIVHAIITGISFLGAGTIFRRPQGEHVEGLTTAASILLVCAIGICVGLDEWLLAIDITLLCLLVLRGLRPIESWLGSKKKGPRIDRLDR